MASNTLFPSIAPPPPRWMTTEQARELIEETKKVAAASLAAGIIAASGRPHSVEEAVFLVTDCLFGLNPLPGNSCYTLWKNSPQCKEPHT
jgi:hypothetical protein